ncbi:Heterodisulfide reductase, subunit A-like protein [Desulfatibacillum aliphaticivorans]|uniref:Heterodisulfide reductase, subunit A-like protein n=1 Tax=Desulfatibacillum aliphaticivorans TaxID=218208 RepID=B8FDV4_DESAL|nr:Heterodisulfide reductase, subunit A-like protein [Desulfatibacillum aliphaticivorans]
MLTKTEIESISGEVGNFSVNLTKQPRYVDQDLCVGCGACAEKCPKKIPDDYNTGLSKRKAIYVEYAQAVPLKYAIDARYCIKLQKDKCGNCEKVCPAGAIRYDQKPEQVTLEVGSVVLAPGFKPFDPQGLDSYKYSEYKNVVTSLEFERILSASGPTHGHVTRPSDGEEPTKIAWLQCIGSRDMNKCDNPYCSAVCCMYAIKEAVIAKEHQGDSLDASIFFMDMRTHGKDFETFYDNARNKAGVRFVRSRVHTITEDPETKDLEMRYVTEDGKIEVEKFHMVVLSVGLDISPELVELAGKLDVNLGPNRFADTDSFSPVATSREGIYVCGAFAGPKDIPQAVVDSSAAASCAGQVLASARNTCTKSKEKIEEKAIKGEPPRIGVFVCKCGINIAGVVDVPSVVEYAKTLPFVEYASENLYSCSQDTQDGMAELIREKNLNRIVVAACTPKTHEPLFQETLINAGLNKYLFEMTNIRNHDSWVHKATPDLATEKARDLVRMAVQKAALIAPLAEAELSVNPNGLVIGGGVAGMAAALGLAKQGYPTHLIEKSSQLGGKALALHKTWKGEDIQENVAKMIKEVEDNENITVYMETELASVDGFVGNFTSTLKGKDKETTLEYGVAIVATGADESKPTEYLYGQDERVRTSLEMDKLFKENDPALDKIQSAAFIQCVGSREPGRPYCSRVCCTHSVDSAIALKERNPDANVYILYRDIRTYGERELLYKKAREAGVLFIRYSVDNKPIVSVNDGNLTVQVKDHVLQQNVEIPLDALTLATAITPPDNSKMAQFYKVPLNDTGYYVERHAKLGPSEFATDGVFLCGLAHYPKPIDESVAQAQAAASRAVTLLAREKIFTSGTVAVTSPANCSECGVCVSLCPYSAPSFTTEGPFAGKASINPVLCKGCGLCVASCRSGAIHLNGFDNNQILAMIDAL